MTNNTHIARSGSGYFFNAPEFRLGQKKSFYGVTWVCWAFHMEKPLYFILFHILIKFKVSLWTCVPGLLVTLPYYELNSSGHALSRVEKRMQAYPTTIDKWLDHWSLHFGPVAGSESKNVDNLWRCEYWQDFTLTYMYVPNFCLLISGKWQGP